MSYKIFIQDTAKLDLIEAARYYNNQQANLGNRFLSAFKSKVKYIKKNPEALRIRYKNIRMAMIAKFPYVIHFQFNKPRKIILILAVFYGGENPEKWYT